MSDWVNIHGPLTSVAVRTQEVAAVELTTTSTGAGSIVHVIITLRAGRTITVQCDDWDTAQLVSRSIRGEK